MTQYHFCKHIGVDDLNQLTVGFIRKEIAARRKELLTEKHKGMKLNLNPDSWVLRPHEGHFSILVPAQPL
jgi:hypothetical protein